MNRNTLLAFNMCTSATIFVCFGVYNIATANSKGAYVLLGLAIVELIVASIVIGGVLYKKKEWRNKTEAMSKVEQKALDAYPIRFGERYGYDKSGLPQAKRIAFERGYEQAEKDFMKKAVEWLKSCLDNGCWVANNLCDYDKKAIVQGFKEMMSE